MAQSNLALSHYSAASTRVLTPNKLFHKNDNHYYCSHFLDRIRHRSVAVRSQGLSRAGEEERGEEAETLKLFDELPQAEKIKGGLALSLVPLIWGTYAPIIETVYKLRTPPPPELLNFMFFVASVSSLTLSSAVSTAPAIDKNNHKNRSSEGNNFKMSFFPSPAALRAGCELGLWLFLGSTLQLKGLKLTTGTQAGIIVQLTTVIVPLVETILLRRPISRPLWSGVLFSFLGVLLLTLDQASQTPIGEPGALDSMIKGDFLVLMAAFAYSTHLLRLDKYAKKVEPLQLAFGKQTAQLGYSTLLTWVPALLSTSRLNTYRDFAAGLNKEELMQMLLVVLWNGVVSSAFTSYAQSFGQRRIPPTIAGLLFATQPLWNALLCGIFLHEKIALRGIIGMIIVLGALSNSLIMLGKEQDSSL